MKKNVYVGLHEDDYGGMTPTGLLVKDAWVFNILPESQDCKGWTREQLLALNEKVIAAWAPHGSMASNLPPDLSARHTLIHDAAITRARALGWPPPMDDED